MLCLDRLLNKGFGRGMAEYVKAVDIPFTGFQLHEENLATLEQDLHRRIRRCRSDRAFCGPLR